MSARWEANVSGHNNDWHGHDLDIDESLYGTCCARMIYNLGGTDGNHVYKSFEDFKDDLKLLRKYANDAGAEFYFCFTSDVQDQERSYLDKLGFETKRITSDGMYFSSITRRDFAKNFAAPKKRRFK